MLVHWLRRKSHSDSNKGCERMSAILEGTPDKRLVLVTGRSYPELAEK
ncbi:hypothetical protein GKD10_20660, partial [Paeniclostridium sordellii]|nr:hypothetical protein [Paeniclostridium sordellii]